MLGIGEVSRVLGLIKELRKQGRRDPIADDLFRDEPAPVKFSTSFDETETLFVTHNEPAPPHHHQHEHEPHHNHNHHNQVKSTTTNSSSNSSRAPDESEDKKDRTHVVLFSKVLASQSASNSTFRFVKESFHVSPMEANRRSPSPSTFNWSTGSNSPNAGAAPATIATDAQKTSAAQSNAGAENQKPTSQQGQPQQPQLQQAQQLQSQIESNAQKDATSGTASSRNSESNSTNNSKNNDLVSISTISSVSDNNDKPLQELERTSRTRTSNLSMQLESWKQLENARAIDIAVFLCVVNLNAGGLLENPSFPDPPSPRTLQSLTPSQIHSQIKPILMKVKTPDHATVERVIEAVKKKALLQGIASLSSDTLAYNLMIAESTGYPDYDTPVLSMASEILKFGRRFCLVDNLAFLKKESAAPSFNRFVNIRLPDKPFVGTAAIMVKSMKVGITDEVKAKDILWKVCQRWMKDFSVHALFPPDSEEPVAPDALIRDLPSDELILYQKPKKLKDSARLKKKGRHGRALSLTNIEEDDKVSFTFWSEVNAFRHKTYVVTKMTKFGIKQERLMGIDRDRITNTARKKKDTEQSLPPWKLIKDIQDATVCSTKPTQFTLIFADGSYTFEALSAQDACEIVEKIKYCKNNTL